MSQFLRQGSHNAARFIRAVSTMNYLNKFIVSDKDIVQKTKEALMKPFNARCDLDHHTIEKLMGRLSFFQSIKKSYGNLYFKKASKNETLISMNNTGKTFFVVLSGSVGINIYLPKQNDDQEVQTSKKLDQQAKKSLKYEELAKPSSKFNLKKQSSFELIEANLVPGGQKHLALIETDEPDIFDMQEVNILKVGDSFGELSLLDSVSKTTATVICKEDSEFACIDRRQFWDILGKIKQKEVLDKLEFLKSISFLEGQYENDLKTLSYHFECLKMKRNQTIFKDGEGTEYMYILKSGAASLEKTIRKNISKKLQEQDKDLIKCQKDLIQHIKLELCTLSAGETFGEEGFLSYVKLIIKSFQKKTRQFTAKCLTDCDIYRIKKVDIEKRLWNSDARVKFQHILEGKWKWRLQRLKELILDDETRLSVIEDIKLQQHLEYLHNLLSPSKFQQVENEVFEIHSKQQVIVPEKQHLKGISSTPSTLYFDCIEASRTFEGLKLAEKEYQMKQRNQSSTNQIQYISLKPSYLPKEKTSNRTKKQTNSLRENKLKCISSNLCPNSSEACKSARFVQLEEKIKPFRSMMNFNDTNLTRSEQVEVKQFQDSLNTYNRLVQISNKDTIESTSVKGSFIDREPMVAGDIMDFIGGGKASQKYHKRKSDNAIRQQFFLKSLAKMNKRLKVLQQIRKGLLKCDKDHFVNEEGEIVTKRDVYDDEIESKFNFITTFDSNQPQQVKKVTGVDDQIIQLKSKIEFVKAQSKDTKKYTQVSQKRSQKEIDLSENQKGLLYLDLNDCKPQPRINNMLCLDMAQQTSPNAESMISNRLKPRFDNQQSINTRLKKQSSLALLDTGRTTYRTSLASHSHSNSNFGLTKNGSIMGFQTIEKPDVLTFRRVILI